MITLATTPQVWGPGRSVADPHVDEIELRIVDEGVPDRTAAADLPPLSTPRPGGLLQRGRLERPGGVTRNGVEAPGELSRLRVVGRHVAAHAQLGSAIAYDDVPPGDARRTRDRVGSFPVDRHDLPDRLAGLAVECHQSTVQRGRVHPALVDRQASIDDVAAGLGAVRPGDLGIVLPQLLAGPRVDRVHDAPRARRVHHSVDDQRCGFQTTLRFCLVQPGQLQPLHVPGVDLAERTEPGLAEVAAMRQPVART